MALTSAAPRPPQREGGRERKGDWGGMEGKVEEGLKIKDIVLQYEKGFYIEGDEQSKNRR